MAKFDDTRWSLVQRANEDRAALETLCGIYRPIVVGWFARRSLTPDVAEDLAQSFFAHVLERKTFDRADPERGKFRAFLFVSLRNFFANHLTREHAQKRGGEALHVSFQDEVAGHSSPEAEFNRDFAAILLARALQRLHEEAIAGGRGDLFQHLQPFLAEAPASEDYQRLSESLDMRRNTIAVAVHRLRNRMRELTIEELRQTVASEADLSEELAALGHSLS